MNKEKALAKFVIVAAVASLWAGAAAAQATPSGCWCPVSGLCCHCVDGSTRQVDISTGVAAWWVRRGNAPSQPAVVNPNVNWTASLPPAAWIRPPGAPTFAGEYVYELRYVIPECVIPGHLAITGQGAADNTATVAVDGGTPFANLVGYTSAVSFTVPAAGLTPGPHTLTVVVTNSGVTGPGNITGLLIRAQITTVCPLQVDPAPGTAPTDGTKQN